MRNDTWKPIKRPQTLQSGPWTSAIRTDFARYGFTRVVYARLFERLEKLGLVVCSVQTRPLHGAFEAPATHLERFDFRWLTLREALAASECAELDLTVEFVREAFERGDACMGAYDGDRLVAYVWRTTHSAPWAGSVWIHLRRQNCEYSYKALVLPEYRGDRLNTSTARCHDHVFTSNGLILSLGAVALSNLASLKSIFRDPNRIRIGYAGVLRWGTFVQTFRTRGLRDYMSLSVRRPNEDRIRDGAKPKRAAQSPH